MGQVISECAVHLLQRECGKALSRNCLRRKSFKKCQNDGVERHARSGNPIDVIALFDVLFLHLQPSHDPSVLRSYRLITIGIGTIRSDPPCASAYEGRRTGSVTQYYATTIHASAFALGSIDPPPMTCRSLTGRRSAAFSHRIPCSKLTSARKQFPGGSGWP